MTTKPTTKNKTTKVVNSTNTKVEPKKPVESVSEPQKTIVEVRCIVDFWDLKENCQRNFGAMFSVDEERASQLKNLHLVEVL